jgi:hypothetical protein
MRIGQFELVEPLPTLREPHAVAMLHPWVDAGNVGTLALNRMEGRMGAREIGRLVRPGMFFDFTRYRPITKQVNGKRTLTVPNTVVKLLHREEDPDILLCHILEPHAFAEDYIDTLVDLFKTLGIKRHCRLGGMWDAVPHTRPLLVTGTLDGKPIEGVRGLTSRRWGAYEGPTTILGQLNTRLEEMGVENMSLMVHLPQYLQLEEDMSGSSRLLEVLTALYKLPQDMPQSELGQRQYSDLSGEVERNPEARRLVRRLEAHYDQRTAAREEQGAASEEQAPPLAPGIQDFLRDVGKKLDEPQ